MYPKPDLILHNVHISSRLNSEAFLKSIAIQNGLIQCIDTDDIVSQFAGPQTENLDFQGGWAYPGFIDAHVHLEQYAITASYVDCETDTMAECLAKVASRAEHTAEGEWILGHGWDQNSWGQFGDRTMLDNISTRHPIYLTSKSLHAAWANTLAMTSSGCFPLSPQIEGGEIVLGTDMLPSGIFLENAMSLFDKVIPSITVDNLAIMIRDCQQSLWKMGITGVHDFDREKAFHALQLLDCEGDLGLRVLKNLPYSMLDNLIAARLTSGFGSDWLKTGAIKMFADGALGPHTAAMLSVYEDDQDNFGIPLLSAEEIETAGRKARQLGYPLAIHAIGDLANLNVLDGFEMLAKHSDRVNEARLPHRIEHVQLLDPGDLPRIASMGICASMQPVHVISDMETAEALWGSRCELSYAWQSVMNTGAMLLFGSDTPVESPNPLWGMHAALTRRKPDGYPGVEGWISSQRVNFKQALAAYTISPATYAAEERQGRLTPGAWADMNVFPQDLSRLPANELREMFPVCAISGGKIRHRKI